MLVSAVWIAPAALATISQVAQRRLHDEPPASAQDLLWAGGDWLVYAFLTPAIFWASNRWPITRPHIARRAFLHLGLSLVFCAAWATCGKLLQATLGLLFRRQEFLGLVKAAGDQFWRKLGSDWLSWVFTTLPFGVVVYLALAGMAHAIRYFVEARESEVQMARLSEQLSGARFSALQAQLNPHFLFNTLNTIAVRARDGDGAGTAQMVEQLSDVLRRTLSRHRSNEVTLEDELELVRQYLAIEQARFSDCLRPTFEVDEAVLSAAVPSFVVQHLVENAIRHGITRRPGAGRIRIVARRIDDTLEVSVIDDGAGIDTGRETPKGHGIENSRERLHALYGERATLTASRGSGEGTVATLRVPFKEMALESDVGER
jgi:two-component system, LytTR family, sensor kinase